VSTIMSGNMSRKLGAAPSLGSSDHTNYHTPLTIELFGGSRRPMRVPAAAARKGHVAGVSFGAFGSKSSPHEQRIQSIRARMRERKKKVSRFAQKQGGSTDGSRPFLSPVRSSASLRPAKRSSMFNVPFNSSSPKTSWIDDFAKVPEDEDESLYHDKLHFTLSRLAWARRRSIFERDRLSWAKGGVLIDRSIDRGLGPTRNSHAQKSYAVESGSNHLLSVAENSRVYMQRYPSDVGNRDMGHICLPLASCTHAAMKSNTKRMVTVDPQGSGLGPPQIRIGQPSLLITRPRHASSAFLASSRANRVPNQR
jgi:hypothetical protein